MSELVTTLVAVGDKTKNVNDFVTKGGNKDWVFNLSIAYSSKLNVTVLRMKGTYWAQNVNTFIEMGFELVNYRPVEKSPA